MTLAEVTRSSVLCVFRTVRSDGEPVACGYQRIVTASAVSDDLVPLPPSITRFAGRIDEIADARKLIEALHRGAGQTKQLFSNELRELARALAAQPELERHPRFLEVGPDAAARVKARAHVAVAPPKNGIVEIAGPERAPFDEIIARYLKATGDAREVMRDPEARYWGGRVEERSLVPLGEAHLGHIGLAEWLRRSQASAA